MNESVLLLKFTFEPLGVVDLARAVRLLVARKVEMVHRGDRDIRTTSIAFPLPSVVRMLYYVRRARKRVALTKRTCCCATTTRARTAWRGADTT